MKYLLLPALACLALAGCGRPEAAADTAAAPAETATLAEAAAPAAPPAETVDPQAYGQYLSCKIDGQPYLAYYADGHTTDVQNPINMAGRTDFATRADEAPLNGDTKLSALNLVLFNLAKKGAGPYTSPKDFHLDGHTCFAKKTGPGVDDVHFIVALGQQLTLSSLKDGVAEGTFALDVQDENDKAHLLKLTEGRFKLALDGGVKTLKVDQNGDVDMNKLMKDVMK